VIYEMARDVGARMLARKFPVLVVYGPERMQRESYDPIIVIERDRGGSDGLAAASGQQRNPRKIMTRTLAVRASIYARSSLPGAMVQDHERECERLVDGLLVALFEWQTAERAGAVSVSGARYLSAADRNDVETWPGVVYELRFNVPRAVFAMTYEGEAKPTAAILGIRSRTEVSAPGFDAETGCDTITQHVAVGVASETCSAFALAMSKHAAPGVATETCSAFALNVAGVPLAGIWDGGYWDADDIAPQADGSDVLSWEPREGSVSLTATAGATAPKYKPAGYFGKPALEFAFASNRNMVADALAALANGDDTPFSVVLDVAPTGTGGTFFCFGANAVTPYHYMTHNAGKNPSVGRNQDGGQTTAVLGTPTIEAGRSLIAQVFAGTTVVIYNDNAPSASLALDEPSMGSALTRFSIGSFRRSTLSQSLSGLVRRVGLTSQQLTPANIQTIYDAWYGVAEPIWVVGDSMWLTGTNGASIRRGIWEHISKNNYRADFVGTNTLGTLWAHPKHDGYSGTNMETHASVVSATLGAGNAIPRAAIAMWWGGTNDMGAGATAYDPVQTPIKARAVLDALAAQGADYIVALDPPEIDPVAQPTPAANVLDYLPKFATVCSEFAAANPTITLVRIDTNAATGGYSAGKYADAFHLNDTGFADVLAAVITEIDAKLSSF
jgi:hypothetical protein